MNVFKKMIAYLLICAVAFYALPLWGTDTGSFIFILLIATPAICFIASLFYGVKNSFNMIYPLLVGVLFIPTLLIYYNSSASVYIIAYALIALFGNLIGSFFRK